MGSSLSAHTLQGLAGARRRGKRSFQGLDFIDTAVGELDMHSDRMSLVI